MRTLLFVLLIALSGTLRAQDTCSCVVPAQVQCRVIAITKMQRNRADLTCITLKGDTAYLKYGWDGIGTRMLVKVGTWLTVRYKECIPGQWVDAKITINH